MSSSRSIDEGFLTSKLAKKIVLGTLLPIILYATIKTCTKTIKKQRLKEKVEKRLKEREEAAETVRNYAFTLPEERAEQITSLSYSQLREELHARRVTCTEALRAYQRKALDSQEKTNCVCMFITDAQEQAEYLDRGLNAGVIQPTSLFGIPISVKECIKVSSHDSTSGFAQELFRPAESNDRIIIEAQGAVPFVITNVPQSLCSFGCSNPIYGKTTHPLNENRVPGGSSGGESALIATGGSILGIGTDIGGSIRIPATFCGLVGFKPSTIRMPHTESTATVPGRALVLANAGPMARDVEACIAFCQTIFDSQTLSTSDYYVPPVKFQNDLLHSRETLRIGYYVTDNYIQPVPAYERAVQVCVRILRSLGHECIPFEVPEPKKFFPLVAANISADGGVYLNRKLDADLYDPDCDFGFVVRKLSPFWKRALSYFLFIKPKLAQLLQSVPRSAEDMREVLEQTKTYRKLFMEKMLQERITVLLSPVMSVYPPEHRVVPQMMPACNYTALYNLLDFAAGTVPVTSVNEEDQQNLQKYEPNDAIEELIKEQSQNCVGMPIGVQVAAPPYKEEVVLRVMQILFQLAAARNDN